MSYYNDIKEVLEKAIKKIEAKKVKYTINIGIEITIKINIISGVPKPNI